MEQLEFSGKITSKEIKTGETNGKEWRRAIFVLESISGDSELKLSTLNGDIMDGFAENELVRAIYKKSPDGKYNNLIGFDDIGESPNTGNTGSTGNTAKELVSAPSGSDANGRRIVRQNCVTNATRALRVMAMVDPEGVKKVLDTDGIENAIKTLAEDFEEWVYR